MFYYLLKELIVESVIITIVEELHFK